MLLLTLATLVATSRAPRPGLCNPTLKPTLARYRVEGTCAPPLVADVSLEAQTCGPRFEIADEHLTRAPWQDATGLLAPGGWPFFFPVDGGCADAGVPRERRRVCLVDASDGGGPALTFTCDALPVEAWCADDARLKELPAGCAGTLTPLRPTSSSTPR